MKLYSLQLFLAAIVVTCQAYRVPLKRVLLVRQRPEMDPYYEVIKHLHSKQEIYNHVDPDPQTLLVPLIYKPGYMRTVIEEEKSSSLPIEKLAEADQKELLVQPVQPGSEINLSEIDREVLHKLSDADRDFIEKHLSQAERVALLANMENNGENNTLSADRFGSFSLSNVAAQLGASAGEFIGSKLAGPIGAKFGIAAGIYLATAAASLLGISPSNNVATSNSNSNNNYGTNSYSTGSVEPTN